MIVISLSVIAVLSQAEKTPTPADAVGWALADIAQVPEGERPFQRYVWIPPWGNQEWVAVMNFAVNTAAGHAATIHNGSVIAQGWMLRYDVRRLAPKPDQQVKLLATWDGLATQDPYFHVPEINSNSKLAIIAPHLAQEQATVVAGLTLSSGAIYRADWLLVKMLTTIEGGKYYEFRQIPPKDSKDKDAKKSPQDVWLESLGVFEQQSKNLNADQRAALLWSQITAKPRRIDVFYGIGRGGNLVSITHDSADTDVDAKFHPIRNLVVIVDKAREIIVELPNGLHGFALTDNAGNFVDAAPDDVARDHTVPAPYTSRLQPAISCIRCHGGDDGWKSFVNDVPKLLSGSLDVIGDLEVGGVTLSHDEVIDRLAGLYAGAIDAPDSPLGRGRRDYANAIAKCSNNLIQQKENQTLVSAMSERVSEIFSGYRYVRVTPEIAAKELGIESLAKIPGGTDPIEGALRAGIPITRADWEAIYADMAGKVERN